MISEMRKCEQSTLMGVNLLGFFLILKMDFASTISSSVQHNMPPLDLTECTPGKMLSLNCHQDEVVGAEVYAAATPNDHLGCTVDDRACISDTLNVKKGRACLWNEHICEFDFTHHDFMLDPCVLQKPTALIAKRVVCVNKNVLYNICNISSITSEYGYITTPGFPDIYSGSLNCQVSIQIPSHKALRLQILTSHLPSNPCTQDFLQFHGGNKKESFCGDVNYTTPSDEVSWLFHGFNSNNLVLTFQSRKESKHYQGFVLYFEFADDSSPGGISMPDITVPPSREGSPSSGESGSSDSAISVFSYKTLIGVCIAAVLMFSNLLRSGSILIPGT